MKVSLNESATNLRNVRNINRDTPTKRKFPSIVPQIRKCACTIHNCMKENVKYFIGTDFKFSIK